MGTWSVGDIIHSRFEVRQIQKGGMGIVYVIWDRHAREMLAAKTYARRPDSDNRDIKQRFEREAWNWINLDVHPNIVHARFIEHINELPYIFLEYVAGGDLREKLARGVTPRTLVSFALPICEAMKHSGEKGIKAHCDLKPENCLVTSDEILKVTDFGLAVSWLDKMKPSDLHQAGTLPYMAPERFQPGSVPDVRVDLYSFGVILFEMLTGHFPFEARTPEAWIRSHIEASPIPLKPRFGALGELADSCLSKIPDQRPRNFSEAASKLDGVLGAVAGGRRPPVLGETRSTGHDNNKGVGLMELGAYEDALACFNRAIVTNPRHVNAWNNRGNLLIRMNRYEEAISSYNRALELDPSHELAWSNKALAAKRLGRLDEATECYKRAVELNARNPQTLCNMGVTLMANDQAAEALAYFDRALAIDRGLLAAWYNKGFLLYNAGRPALALKCVDEALRLNPDDADAWCLKGWALGRLGRHEEEVQAHTKALALNDALDSSWCGLGTGLSMMGRFREARLSFNRALSLNPDNTDAKEALRRLAGKSD